MSRSELIGYWSRVNGLAWDDVWGMVGELFPDADGDIHAEFQAGYQQADMELLREKIEDLKADLYDADPDGFSNLGNREGE